MAGIAVEILYPRCPAIGDKMKANDILEQITKICTKNPPQTVNKNQVVAVIKRGPDGKIIQEDLEGVHLYWKWTYDENITEASISVADDYVAGGVCCFPEDDPEDLCAFASKTCDTIEKIEEFLKLDLLYWTGNHPEEDSDAWTK